TAPPGDGSLPSEAKHPRLYSEQGPDYKRWHVSVKQPQRAVVGSFSNWSTTDRRGTFASRARSRKAVSDGGLPISHEQMISRETGFVNRFPESCIAAMISPKEGRLSF